MNIKFNNGSEITTMDDNCNCRGNRAKVTKIVDKDITEAYEHYQSTPKEAGNALKHMGDRLKED